MLEMRLQGPGKPLVSRAGATSSAIRSFARFSGNFLPIVIKPWLAVVIHGWFRKEEGWMRDPVGLVCLCLALFYFGTRSVECGGSAVNLPRSVHSPSTSCGRQRPMRIAL